MSDLRIYVPREGVSDDGFRLVGIHATSGQRVAPGDLLLSLESSKTVVDVVAEVSGYLHLPPLSRGATVAVGALIAVISPSPESRADLFADAASVEAESPAGGPLVSRAARRLMAEHGLSVADFAGLAAVREADVRARLAASEDARPHEYGGLDPLDDAEFDAVRGGDSWASAQELLFGLRRTLWSRYRRHVPLGTLVGDREKLARDLSFGEGSSVYDEALILGDVTVGRHCWVGPFTILDGAHAPLRIGDHSTIGAGSHLYTHDTIHRAITGGKARTRSAPTTIGERCFIAPHVVIGPGTVVGDGSFVAAGSYVQGRYPEGSLIQGNPARLTGKVVRRGDEVVLQRYDQDG